VEEIAKKKAAFDDEDKVDPEVLAAKKKRGAQKIARGGKKECASKEQAKQD